MTDERREAREPLFNAPWPALLLTLLIVGSFVLQRQVREGVWLSYALVPADLFAGGRWETLTTALFLHGGWIHTLMNAAGAIAFGAPVSRLFGTNLRGAVVFFLFFLVTGALSGLGYAWLHPDSAAPVVGASGAVSGLMGAASRMIDRPGQLGAIWTRSPVGMGVAWIVVNLVVGFTTLAPGTGGAQVAWEAHIAGFFAGLALVGFFPRVRTDDSQGEGL